MTEQPTATEAWTTPELETLNCGMEINMYFPADGDDRGDGLIDAE